MPTIPTPSRISRISREDGRLDSGCTRAKSERLYTGGLPLSGCTRRVKPIPTLPTCSGLGSFSWWSVSGSTRAVPPAGNKASSTAPGCTRGEGAYAYIFRASGYRPRCGRKHLSPAFKLSLYYFVRRETARVAEGSVYRLRRIKR